MLNRMLRFADYQVETYASGEAFLESLGSRLPACAVVDLHMPGLSGVDVQRRINQAVRRVPVVMITASDELSLQDVAQSAGAIRLLRKPFSTDELLEAVAAAVRGDAGLPTG